ncbi:hypothetical protein JJV70_15870 [Streptomyces sp. JJ66]|uniref:hypothetical protein n=1 Tax=Streptomyces sp. JJ66 TaxID=2803843 RepID=UPI001C57A6E8|nr:hypothetical protein [Streptomyces sp. JJ66]MBW1603554.1 hypothetical protein [Streptomyces sp. JJ66]
MQRRVVVAALLGLTRAASAAGDYWVNATKAVLTIRSVLVSWRSRSSTGFPSQGAGVAVVRRRGLASRFALVGGR